MPPSNDGETQTLPLLNPAGGSAGTVSVPDSVVEGAGELVVTVIDEPNLYDDTTLGSPVLELLLFDQNGRAVTDLEDEVEICLQTTEDSDDDDICLGFLDQDETWVCEDPCLEQRDEGYCGKTDHFTKFSLLLDTGEGGSNASACTSSSQDNLYIWLSLAFVGCHHGYLPGLQAQAPADGWQAALLPQEA